MFLGWKGGGYLAGSTLNQGYVGREQKQKACQGAFHLQSQRDLGTTA